MRGLCGLFCLGGSRGDAEAHQGSHKRRRRRRHKHIHANAAAGGLHVNIARSHSWDGSPPISPLSARSSVLSEGDFFDATSEMDHMSADGSLSPPMLSARHSEQHGVLDRLASWWEQRHHTSELHDGGGGGRRTATPVSPVGSQRGHARHSIVEDDDEARTGGCISLFSATQAVLAHRRFLGGVRPPAGSSFTRRSETEEERTACCSWEPADACTFMIRSEQYMRTKVKVHSAQALYRIIGVDLYSFDSKLFHVAQHVELPKLPQLGPGAAALPPDQRLPPLLIFNLQLPTYGPSLFGACNGPGHSLVYYFALEEGWEPSAVENQAALGLLQRFVHNKREHDGQPTRDRLKLIPRVVNVDEWAEKGPLSGYEHRLLTNYNDKPLLTRPQQRFYHGEGYLEIDLDVHNYAYVARRAFHGFLGRLAPVVFENAFVVQGNRPEELPEVVLGAVRVYRVDFLKSRPFPADSVQQLGNREGPPQDPEAPR